MTILRRILLVAIAAAIAPARPARAQAVERLFYYVDRESAYNSLVRHIGRIDVLGPQVYTVDSLGVVWGSLDRRVLALPKAHGSNV